MKRDRISNEKIIDFFPIATYTVGTHNSTIFDLQNFSAGTNREDITNMLFSLMIAAGWVAAGTVNITIQHSNTNSAAAMVAHSTVSQAAQSNDEDLYLFEAKDFRRYVRLQMVVAAQSVTAAVLGNGSRSRREPVYQLGTELTVTEGSYIP